ncbi:MAG TPA: hypothetical protein VHR72_01690 [Gemmataceae bacterium]|jgi:hypothetical protein|nr:hypothetical protein [Gemmataceae bacterium]
MIRALAIKELRETAWIWLLAAAWFFVTAMEAMRISLLPDFLGAMGQFPFRSAGEIPFVSSSIASSIGLGMALFGVALGIGQTAGEMRSGTYPLTLHLPISRRKLFAVKLGVGLFLVWGIGGIALGSICLWAATPGTHASPFEWSMTLDAWRVWFAAPIAYLGGIATGLLPARWFGTRLFPAVTATVTTLTLVITTTNGAIAAIPFFALALVAASVFAIVIDHLIATRDFS